VAEGIPVATGAAFQSKYRREAMGDASADQVTVCFFGDGASNNGQFFECLNMAALWKLPIIYVVENNKWAICIATIELLLNQKSIKKPVFLVWSVWKWTVWMWSPFMPPPEKPWLRPHLANGPL
jgi:TPP-dependent pyruvate/acetoin dehydrogenase alpha subunit